jgi:aspartate/methionine/tyrosine aminotransferase
MCKLQHEYPSNLRTTEVFLWKIIMQKSSVEQALAGAITYHVRTKEALRDTSAGTTRRSRLEANQTVVTVRRNYLSMNAFYSLTRAAKTIGFPYIDIASSVEVDDTERPLLNEVMSAAHTESMRRGEYMVYPSSDGLSELHQAIATDFFRWGGINIDPGSETMVTGGIMDAYKKTLSAFNWTHVVVPDWCPYFARAQAQLQGRQIIEAPLNLETGELDLQEVERRLEEVGANPEKTLFYVTHPSAPAGTVMEDAFIEQDFLPFIRETGMTFFVDSYIRATRFDTDQHLRPIISYPGAKELGVEAITIAKEMGLPGVRVGGIAGNRDVIKGIKELAAANIDMIPGSLQIAAAKALREVDPTPIGRRLAQELREEILPRFEAMGWPVLIPKAGIDMMIEIPPQFLLVAVDDPSLLASIAIFKHFGVAIAPGSVFAPDGKRYLRMVLKQEKGTIPAALDQMKDKEFNWNTFTPTIDDILYMQKLLDSLDLTKL